MKQMMINWILLLWLGINSAYAQQPNPQIELAAVDFQAFKVVNLVTHDPARRQRAQYQGYPLAELLTAWFGPEWQQAQAVMFHCADGYQPSIPVTVILQHQPILAFGQAGRRSFEPIRRANGQTIDPGPYYLVWDTDQDPDASKENWLSWPWQLSRLELIPAKSADPVISPPAGSSELVEKGYLSFQQHCLKCHSLNGYGAKLGPELNYPLNVTEYWQADVLKQFILNPQSVRLNSPMAAFYAGLPDQAQRVDEVIAYLKAMVKHKQAPDFHP